MLANLIKAMQLADQFSSNNSAGQDDLFGLGLSEDPQTNTSNVIEFVNAKELDDFERLKAEKETLGFYVKGHPISKYEKELVSITTTSLIDVKPGIVRVAGYIEGIRTRSGQRGRMAELRIDDKTARMVVNLYSEAYEKYRSMLQKDKLVIIIGEAIEDDYYASGVAIKADMVVDLNEIRSRCGSLLITLDKQSIKQTLPQIQDTLKNHLSDKCHVIIDYANEMANGKISLGDNWRVNINDEILNELSEILGDDKVSVMYRDVHKHFTAKPKFKYISGLY
jgi:DNA polymerase-3 subunit alpha